MMSRIIIGCLLVAGLKWLPANAQYYYQDIYHTRKTNQEHQQYRKKGVHQIRIKSFDAQNTLSKGFNCVKKIADDYKEVFTQTQSFSTGSSVVISYFDDSGRITHSIDSSAMSVTDTRYHYNTNDQIDSLVFSSFSMKGKATYLYQKDTFRYREVHVYQYDNNGNPDKMTRLKNHIPYSKVFFRTDSAGKVTKESEVKNRDTLPPVYYKYDTSGRLSDVFHYNPGKQKMAPDYLFDYDEQGRLKQKIVAVVNTHAYLLWEYAYTPKGLISQEKCYDQQHRLQGIMKYEYGF